MSIRRFDDRRLDVLIILGLLLINVFVLRPIFHSARALDPPCSSFPELGDEIVVLDFNASCWDGARGGPHNLDVIELNKDGHRYWGYYGTADHDAVGLAFSNDLENWTRYSMDTPLIDGAGWPTVGIQNDTIHIFYIKHSSSGKIWWATSPVSDGYDFTEQGIAVENANNPHDPFLWHNPVDGEWWLLWKENINVGTIKCCHSLDIEDLWSASHMVLRTETNSSYGTLAAPGIFYWNNTYYLTDESIPDIWQMRAFYSDVLAPSCFNGACECSNSPILHNDDACGFPHVEGNQLYYYWSHRVGPGWNWNLKLRKSTLRPVTKFYVDPALVEKDPEDVCTTFNVNVTIENVTDLFAFDFNLAWDNSLITLVDVDYNTTLDKMWGPGNWFLAKNETGAGYYELAVVSTSTGFNSTEATPLVTSEFHVETAVEAETLIHFTLVKLSDSKWQSIPAEVTDGRFRMIGWKPKLVMNPNNVTCCKHCEHFTVQINLKDAVNVTDFAFELRFNASLLDYVGVVWGAFLDGETNVTNVDEKWGVINGDIDPGTPASGDGWLLNVTFHVNKTLIWKDCIGWENLLEDKIWFDWAKLSHLERPDLYYKSWDSGRREIDVTDVGYAFAAVRGDVDSDGDVDVFDLRVVAYYYGVEDGDPRWVEASKYDLNCDGTVDIFDIVIVATNYGYTCR